MQHRDDGLSRALAQAFRPSNRALPALGRCLSLAGSLSAASLQPSASTVGSLLTALGRDRWDRALALLRAAEPKVLYGPKGGEVSVTWDAGLAASPWRWAVLLLAGDPCRGPESSRF